MVPIELRKLYKLIAEKHNLNLLQVEEIVASNFRFVAHIMKTKVNRQKRIYPSIRVPYWGIFFCPPWFLEKFKKDEKKEH